MQRKQAGITLVEMLVTVGIVGILAAIAYPSYRTQVIRSTRTEGKIALEQRAQQLEKCYTRYMNYQHPQCAAGQSTADGATVDRHYQIGSVITPTAFTLTATPINTQQTDTECAVLRLTETGRRDIVGGTGTAARCW